jgi:hypothetical protein
MDDELRANYIALQKSTGESWESIARRVEDQNDERTAAWLRSQAAGDGEVQPDEAPKGRSGKGSLSTASAAEGAPAEGAPAETAGA